MNERLNTSCWDCPKRTGLSKLTGKIACKFYRSDELGRKKIEEQRGNCKGPYPFKVLAQGVISNDTVEDTIVTTTTWDSVYIAGCTKEQEEIQEVPEVVSTAMRLNCLDMFTHRTQDKIVRSRSDHEQIIAFFQPEFKTDM